jgi:DNA-binding transcriptional ArsR family regulator
VVAQIVDPTPDQVGWAVDTFKLLADPTRLRVVWALLHGEHSVNELAYHVGAQPAAVSQHLAKLRLAKLVSTRREGTTIFYTAENELILRLSKEALFHTDHTDGIDDASDNAVGVAPESQVAGRHHRVKSS